MKEMYNVHRLPLNELSVPPELLLRFKCVCGMRSYHSSQPYSLLLASELDRTSQGSGMSTFLTSGNPSPSPRMSCSAAPAARWSSAAAPATAPAGAGAE